ncbi:MAG: glycosyltransferase family 9 protein [Candidatus Omnitrophica bacterium]|nr:glycosyltransferase family 9 protein [Candidatus Omnitrophota bacterium]
MCKSYELKQSCRFFYPDRPCIYHKIDGQKCSYCCRYEPADFRILVIKLGALGDVLRTTAICEPLKALYPSSLLTWITEEDAVPILLGNGFVDRIVVKSSALQYILLFKFDLLINLDLDKDALIFAGLAKTKEKRGFWFDENGIIQFSSDSAKKYFLLSHDDDLKKENKKTYQSFVSEIAGLPGYGEIIVPVSDSSKEHAKQFAEKNKLIGNQIVGAIVGTGNKWITKRWPEKHFVKLFSILKDFKILVFGGYQEKDLMQSIISKSGKNVINTGHMNSIDQFFGLLNLCDVVVCSDTFALHAAIGLKKRVVALFGPTSANEIEMYGRGEKIVSDMPCICCYKRICEKSSTCMETITPKRVAEAIRRLLDEKRKDRCDNSDV